MAQLDMDIPQDFINAVVKASENEAVFSEMVAAGQEIMKNEILEGARKHIVTGKMQASIKCSKPVLKDGACSGRVYFSGEVLKYKSKKSGKTISITNWLKAFRIEYGTRYQKAEPFVAPAILNSESKINSKMGEIMDKEGQKKAQA